MLTESEKNELDRLDEIWNILYGPFLLPNSPMEPVMDAIDIAFFNRLHALADEYHKARREQFGRVVDCDTL